MTRTLLFGPRRGLLRRSEPRHYSLLNSDKGISVGSLTSRRSLQSRTLRIMSLGNLETTYHRRTANCLKAWARSQGPPMRAQAGPFKYLKMPGTHQRTKALLTIIKYPKQGFQRQTSNLLTMKRRRATNSRRDMIVTSPSLTYQNLRRRTM
jgi:hypothetical protein